ncbi:unnamed protein product [Clavelina lepadiformis]|uniref:Uncharacterized protein n=1 Tax=Clavelina lepadiformis TaxID=159417 RepID=A0ABP0H583_CLALP
MYMFLNEHKCRPDIFSSRNECGFAPWRDVEIYCKDLDQDLFDSVLCDTKCRNPQTGATLGNNFTNVRRLCTRYINGTSSIQLPCHCSCQLKNSANRVNLYQRRQCGSV